MSRVSALLSVLLLGTLLLQGCNPSDSPSSATSTPTPAETAAEAPATPAERPSTTVEAPPVQGTVVVLSSRDEQFMDPLWDLVRKRHPQLKLVVDYGKDAGTLDRLRAERDRPRADLVLSKGSAAVAAASSEGLLAPLPEAIIGRVPSRFRGGDNRWLGLSARARILVARRDLSPQPKSIEVLADPAWAGKVGRTVATNSSFVGGIAAMVATQGEEGARSFLKGLHANTEDGALVFPKHTPTVAAVAEGSAQMALVNHYYYYRNVLGKRFDSALGTEDAQARIEAAPIVAIYAETGQGGVAWNVTGGGLVAGGPNRASAEAVLEVLLSDEGQTVYSWSNREYPVVEGLPAAPGVVGPSEFRWAETPLTRLAELTPVAVRLIQDVGLK